MARAIDQPENAIRSAANALVCLFIQTAYFTGEGAPARASTIRSFDLGTLCRVGAKSPRRSVDSEIVLKSPEPPDEQRRAPGTGFFLLLALVTIVVLAMVWAFTAH
jgi:hypothetical protein